MPRKKKAPKLTEKELAEIRRQKFEEEQAVIREKIAQEDKEYGKRIFMLERSNKEISVMKKDVKRFYVLQAKKKFSISNTDDDFPKIHEPQDLRKYVRKWYDEEAREDKEVNWFVDCDEYSLLTQDVSIKNTSFVHTRDNRPDIGDKFANRIGEILKILGKMDLFLRKPERLLNQHFQEMLLVKTELRKHVESYLNKFTHGVLSNIERDMEFIDAITAKYVYDSAVFNADIWTFRQVPLPPDSKYIKTITMDTVQATMHLPKQVNLDQSSLRALLLYYDHLSDSAPSFAIRPFGIITDFHESAELEYNTRRELARQKVQQMKEDRLKWEEAQQLKALALEAEVKDKSKNKKKKKKRGKKSKHEPPEPPIITDNYLVDVDEEYLNLENEEYERMKDNMGPNSLNLGEDEINLRYYKIHSRLYSLEYIVRPAQEKHISRNYILKTTKKPDILKYNNYFETYIPPPNLEDISDIHILQEWQEKDEDNLDKLIVIEITLTDKVMWWTEPTVCRWEPWEESTFFSELEPDIQQFHLEYDKIVEFKRKLLFSPPEIEKKSAYTLLDLCLNKLPEEYNYHQLIQEILIPRMPEEYKFDCEKKFLREMAKRAELLRMKIEREIQKEREIFEELAAQERMEEILEEENMRKSTFSQKERTKSTATVMIEELEEEVEELIEGEDSLVKVPDSDATIQVDDLKETTPKTLFPEPRFVPDVLIENCIHESEDADDSCQKLSEFIRSIDKLRYEELPIFSTIEEIDSKFEGRREFDSAGKEEEEVEEEEELTLDDQIIAKEDRNSKVLSLKSKQGISNVSESTNVHFVSSEKHVEKHKSSKKKKRIKEKIQEDVPDSSNVSKYKKGVLIPHEPGKWSNRDIPKWSFDFDTKTIKFHTNRLGYFAVAFPKYFHFPFKDWSLRTNPEMDQSVILNIITQNFTIDIIISQAGYKVQVIIPKKFPLLKMTDFVQYWELKILMNECNMNIFPEIDASSYISDHCEKHSAMEMHNYRFFGKYCLTHEFLRSPWNHLSERRAAVVQCRPVSPVKQVVNPLQSIWMSPLRSAFVEVEELCTDLSIVRLKYHLTPSDQVYCPDMNILLDGDLTEFGRRLVKTTRLMLKYQVSNIFRRLRLLSFS